MAKDKVKKREEKLSARIKRAYRRGYVNGFNDSDKMGKQGSKFWGSRGYAKGYGDKNKINKIQKRYDRYRG